MAKLIQDITTNLKIISARPPIAGYEDFICPYLFIGEKKALVDIGPKAAIPGLLNALSQDGISPAEIDYIILTHIHIDHAGGTGMAVKEMKNARILMHSRGVKHMVDPAVLWQASQDTLGEAARNYGSYSPVPEDRIIVAEDGMKLDLGKGLVLEIYLTPGHASHHFSVFDRKDGVLLAGDSAGIYTNGFLRLTTPPPFRLQEYLASLDRMIALQPAKLGYAHAGCYDNAVTRLQAIRTQAILWHEIAQQGAKEGKTADEVIRLIKEKDKTIGLFDKLDKDTYRRESLLLNATIQGLMTAKP
ncbi:MAG: MBL fold metallo-hydrolase [Dehalococcoidales bacterium]|nr:MBL fold metallo-hydrolase [Dehalococcoidales bacterium]